MKKVLIFLGLILIFIIGVTFILLLRATPDLSQYKGLVQPMISVKEDQKMLVVIAKGDPDKTAGQAMALLYKAFFATKKHAGNMEFSAPRARWPRSENMPKEQWVGMYGLSVPQNVDQLPQIKIPAGLELKLELWDYDEVAEILHIGSYSTESGSVDKLRQYIKEKNYEICGDHEEEYLKGPGMFFKGNPETYYTIIRYPVRKVEIKPEFQVPTPSVVKKPVVAKPVAKPVTKPAVKPAVKQPLKKTTATKSAPVKQPVKK